MASSVQPSHFLKSNPLYSPTTLPILTSIIGLGACAVGISSFLQPIASATIYAIPIPGRISSPSPSGRSKASLPSKTTRVNTTYVYAYGLRYLSTGASVLALSYYYTRRSYSALIRTCLGIVLLCGSLASLGDAVVAREMQMEREKEGGKEWEGRAVFAHGMRALVWAVAGGVWMR